MLSVGNGGVSGAPRAALFAEWGLRCVTCGARAERVMNRIGVPTFPIIGQPGNWLSVDHVSPDRRDDLAVLCLWSNSRKGAAAPIYDLVRTSTRSVTHLSNLVEPDLIGLTLCGLVPAGRVGGWTARRPWSRRPARMCERCWAIAPVKNSPP